MSDNDPSETSEWLDAFDDVVAAAGPDRAQYLLTELSRHAAANGLDAPDQVTTPYYNTIPTHAQPPYPGNLALEKRIRAFIRWNAAVMVVRANHRSPGVGGHLATYASTSTLLEVGLNHFFVGHDDPDRPADHIYFQGHAAPGIYARSFVEGRLDEDDLDGFRAEASGGLSSYPHPRTMPEYWEYSTVSMGLGPLMAIHQAHVDKALLTRGMLDSTGRVWCFVGDGELDEPEATSALRLAGRNELSNLTFIVNCNLQRLDGPVRGNGKIIQELEGLFRGAGWNVIKVVWGTAWDDLLTADRDGVLQAQMERTPDGEFQRLATLTGAQIRTDFFGPDPRLTALVAHLTDDELTFLPRGGHDPLKIAAAYQAATDHTAGPTVILAKTVKGWALGSEIEARNATHQIKKMTNEQLRSFRDRIGLSGDIPDSALIADLPPYCRPEPGSPEAEYLAARRTELGGRTPARDASVRNTVEPSPSVLSELYAGSGRQAASTTMAFVRALRALLRDDQVGPRVVPVVSDEARTFGMESLIAEHAIYEPGGQSYTAVDAGLPLHYRESPTGRIFEEGISEAGALATFGAAATSYANNGLPLLPVFLFYSMFGFQRVGDLIWALTDMRARGILAGCTAGRTTLQGEGLQHNDGHSLLLASTNPAVHAYDPTFAYELAVITEAAMSATLGPDPKDYLWYLTLYNENWVMPPFPDNPSRRAQILEGMHLIGGMTVSPYQPTNRHITLLTSGPAYSAVTQAATALAAKGVTSDIWSVTSYGELRNDILATQRYNLLHPTSRPRQPIIARNLSGRNAPVVAVTDHVRALPDLVASASGRPFTSLGTDGFGISDDRPALRAYFAVDAAHVEIAALSALASQGAATTQEVTQALIDHGIDPD